MISVVFTRSDKLGSKLIRWGSRSQCSHMAFVLDARLVFHSTFSHGVHLQWLYNFLWVHTVVHRIDFDLPLELEESIYLKLISMESREYDYLGLIYLSLAYLGHRLLGMPMPKKNKWSSNHRDMCIELASALRPLGLDTSTLDTTHPEEVYYFMKDKLNGYISNT